MSWQKCPKCNGMGKDQNYSLSSSTCFICKGYGIINEQTGAPLYETVTNITSVQGPDLRLKPNGDSEK